MRKTLFILAVVLMQSGCMNEKQQAESILRHYINRKTDPIRNYQMESEMALWNATVTGNEADYQKMIDIELDFNRMNQNNANQFSPDCFFTSSPNVFTKQQDFDLLRKLKDSGLITDTLLKRQLNVLFQTFMSTQIESERYKKYVMREIEQWQVFSAMKVELDGRKYGSAQLDSVRIKTSDPKIIDTISESYRKICHQIADDIIRNVKERNEFAVEFGYPDYYYLALDDKEQTPEKVKAVFDELESKTREPYFEAKQVIDKMLAKRLGIDKSDLRPWYYNDERTSYLTEKFTRKMDSLFVNIDPVRLTADFFASIGLPIDDVIKKSRLEDGPGKANLTAMINIDFKNDIRLIAGITQTYDGMCRMMHLGGHASEYKSISDDIPYLLKTPNTVIVEGIGRYFENLASDYNWLKREIPIAGKVQDQVALICRHMHQVDRLLRCRKLMAMAEFEREMYHNPDQDLDLLWQEVNRKYLGIIYPAGKKSSYWAANKFGASLSCSIHNFVLADIFAAQLKHSVENKVFKGGEANYSNNKVLGDFMVANFYSSGNLYQWEQLIARGTGEPLNTSYFIDELTGEGGEMGESVTKSN